MGGARKQSLQSKVMADERASTTAPRNESQLSKEEVTKRRAADALNALPPPLRIDATPPAVAAAPAEVRSRIDAAGGSVEGRVTEKETGQGVANAQVLVEGTSLSATTDKDGKFRLENAPQGARRLIVRRIGYRAETVPVAIEGGKMAAAQIGISASATELAEVVVTSAPSAPSAPAVATLGAATNKVVATAPLRVVRADSTSSMKRNVYEVARGVEVTLTESPAQTAERDNAANDLARQKAAAPQRTEAAPETQVLSGRVAGAVAAPPAAPMLPFNTISWTDRGKRYTLTGRLTTKDLEGIKARLMQARR